MEKTEEIKRNQSKPKEKIRKCFKKTINVLRKECYRADILCLRKAM